MRGLDGAYDHGIAGRLDPDHVEGMRVRDPEPAALADRVVGDALVPAEDGTFDVDDGPRLQLRADAIFEELAGISGGEADVLAIGLAGDLEADFLGDRPDLLLGQPSERKEAAFELILA
ncbi:hypothetical protein D3C87_1474030 [compost metagenome]